MTAPSGTTPWVANCHNAIRSRLAIPLLTLRGPATERRRGEPGVRAEPLAIGEFAHEGFPYKHGGALYANPPKANELLDHFLLPVRSLFLEYCVTAPLQFGDLRAH